MPRFRLAATSARSKSLASAGLFAALLVVGSSQAHALIIGPPPGGSFVGINANLAAGTCPSGDDREQCLTYYQDHANTEVSNLVNGGIYLARLGASGTCTMNKVTPTDDFPQLPLSTYTDSGIAVDLLIDSAYPCDTSFPGTGVNGMLQDLINSPNNCPYNTGPDSTDDVCCPNTDWPSGLSTMEQGAYCWAFNAYSYYEANCSNAGNCPELEVLNEPAYAGTDDKEWGSQAYSYQNDSGQYVNQNAYAYLLNVTSNYFSQELGADSPIVLASYDGGMGASPGTTMWGSNVWNNTIGIDLADDNVSPTVHAYPAQHTCNTDLSNLESDVNDALKVGAVYVTEFGWDASGDLSQGGAACGYKGGTWDTTTEPDNYCTFMNWALGAGAVQLFPFAYSDYGTISPYSDWWGMVYWNEPDAKGGSPDYGLNGTLKPVWTTVTDFATTNSC